MDIREIKYTAPYALTQGYKGDTCYDLHYFKADGDYAMYTIRPGETKKLPTGLCVELPEGWAADVTGRSGNSSRGLHVQLGKIDESYRGEISVIAYNATCETIMIAQMDRIAQIEFYKKDRHRLSRVSSIDANTARGEEGFGSTGK